MRIFNALALITLLGAVSPVMAAGSFDGSRSLLCAPADFFECGPETGCNEVSAAAIDAPRFLHIDFSKKQATGMHAGGVTKVSAIERLEVVDGKLMLGGAEDGHPGARDGLGWNIAITQESGNMTFAGAGDNAAFVAFGACTPL